MTQAHTNASTQAVTPELRRWIIEQAEAGCQPEAVLQAMVASGWEEEVAIGALEQTLRNRLTEVQQARVVPPGVPVPEPDLSDGATTKVVEGHAVQVVAAMKMPRVVVFGNLLSHDECDALVALARPRMVRSETVVNESGGNEVNAARTSSGMFFDRAETPLIDRIERRIAELLRWPVENGEGLQILHYKPGAEYKPHHDYFDPAHAGSPTLLSRGGQRVGTLIMYLHEPVRGGATTFPDALFDVAPVKGQGVFFSYDRAHPITRTLHGGAPVIEGEKWVATKWLREREFV
jgi:prolyl 4-hydroxylase